MAITSYRATTSEEKIRFRPAASALNLKRRALLNRITRDFFDSQGFLEVETPVLSRDVVVDRFVESIPVRVPKAWSEVDSLTSIRFADGRATRERDETFYLQTSPEFAMKRLLASGLDAIYQLARAFRSGDRGRLHNVEFTMLEWYRRDVDYRGGRALLASFVEKTSEAFYRASGATRQKAFGAKVVERTFADAFEEKTTLDPHACASEDLRRLADRVGAQYPTSYVDGSCQTTKDDWLDLVFGELVQPSLGEDAPVILYDYPGSQSQLAKCETVDGRAIARRFELFVSGIELANGYDELLDPRILRERNARVAQERQKDGAAELPRESRLLAAMDEGYPPSTGCALGLDRFLLALLGADSIDDVLAFPIEIA